MTIMRPILLSRSYGLSLILPILGAAGCRGGEMPAPDVLVSDTASDSTNRSDVQGDSPLPVDATGTDVAQADVTPTDARAMDAGTGGVTMAVLTNPAAAGHPAPNSIVSVSDALVALTPRFFVSQSMTTHKCLFSAWVGTSAGGAFSAIELVESIMPPTGATDCFGPPATVGVIPQRLAIGDTIQGLRGQYENFCPMGMTCPTGTTAEMAVDATHMGQVAMTGSGGVVPSPTSVMVTDVNGTGATPAPMDLSLQNTLVRISGGFMQIAPTTANHDAMSVSQSATAGSPVMLIEVSKFTGASGVRTTLAGLPVGSPVGDITGVLNYSFGNWVIQLRQAADISGVMRADGGVAVDAATGSDATGG